MPEAERHCPSCGNTKLRNLGRGDSTSVLEYVPAHLVRHVHIRERLCCPCGSGIITAPPPDKVFDKARYGPGLMAHTVTSKCADSMPHYRARRKFFKALSTTPQATEAMVFIRDLYAIEYEALDLKILGTRAHQRLRASKSALVLQKFNTWLQEQRETHLPNWLRE